LALAESGDETDDDALRPHRDGQRRASAPVWTTEAIERTSRAREPRSEAPDSTVENAGVSAEDGGRKTGEGVADAVGL
jgi:hypothetical protein